MSKQRVQEIQQILDGDSAAAHVANLWSEWNGARSAARSRWKETIGYVYATSTMETTNAQNEHSHSTHIPKITQIHDNLIANYNSALFPNERWMKFVGRSREDASLEKRKAVEAYLRTKHRQSGFQTIMAQLLSDWVLYGNCFAAVTYENSTHENDEGDIIQNYVGPKVYRISPYDIVFNPLSDSFERSPKIVRTVKSVGDFFRDFEENPELGYSEEVIKRMRETRRKMGQYKDSEIDKAAQLSFDGFGSLSQYIKSGSVEVLELYGDLYDPVEDQFYKNHVITVIDRIWVVRARPMDNWAGRPHIYHCGWRLRPDNLWAMGPLDNLVGMQYLINHLENARADAFDQMLVPTRVITGQVYEDAVPGKPGGEYRIPDGQGGVTNLAPDTTVLNADVQIDMKEAQMEAYAGSPRETMGIRSPGEKTAYEVEVLQNAASRIFQNKIVYFEREFIEKVVNAEVEVARRNLEGADEVQIMDEDFGVQEFLQISREDLTAKGTIVAKGAQHFNRINQLAGSLGNFQNIMMSDELMAQHFPSKRLARAWEELLGFEDLELYEEFGRLDEQMEQQQLSMAMQEEVQTQQAIQTDVENAEMEEQLDDAEMQQLEAMEEEQL